MEKKKKFNFHYLPLVLLSIVLVMSVPAQGQNTQIENIDIEEAFEKAGQNIEKFGALSTEEKMKLMEQVEQTVYPAFRCFYRNGQNYDTDVNITVDDMTDYKVMKIGTSEFFMVSVGEHVDGNTTISSYITIDENDLFDTITFTTDKTAEKDWRYSISIDYGMNGDINFMYFTRKPYTHKPYSTNGM